MEQKPELNGFVGMKMQIISFTGEEAKVINELQLHSSFGQMPKVGEYIKYKSEIFDVSQVLWDFDLLIVQIFVEKTNSTNNFYK